MPESFDHFEHLGEALYMLRRWRGMKQKDVAETAGITRPMLSSYERGKQVPTLQTLSRILNALDCSVKMLAGAMPSAKAPATASSLGAAQDIGETTPELSGMEQVEAFVSYLTQMMKTAHAPGAETELKSFVELLWSLTAWLSNVRLHCGLPDIPELSTLHLSSKVPESSEPS